MRKAVVYFSWKLLLALALLGFVIINITNPPAGAAIVESVGNLSKAVIGNN